MSNEFEIVMKVNQDICSRCAVCTSLCPYEAIEEKIIDDKLEEVSINHEKCQACGICPSACPSAAIETLYYDSKSLVEYAHKLTQEAGVSNLIVACKGNGPSPDEIAKLTGVKTLGKYNTLRVPCLSRVSPEVIVQTIASGVSRLVFVPCEEDRCRFKDGSKMTLRRIMLTQAMLRQLGYDPTMISIEQNSVKAEIDLSNCITCLNCLYVCKYDTIKLDGSGPKVDLDKCAGCGVCVGLCPHLQYICPVSIIRKFRT
ncbi:MAG: 4Fe-4S binding protein [Candidatus Bathyarchaeota archaeon]